MSDRDAMNLIYTLSSVVGNDQYKINDESLLFYMATPCYTVAAHQGYPCWCWLRFSDGTNSPGLPLLDR